CDRTRQYRLLAVLVITLRQLDDQVTCFDKERTPRRMRGEQRAVTGQCKAKSLRKAVHGIGGEHSRTRSARGTCSLLRGFGLLVRKGRIRPGHHRVYQVEGSLFPAYQG